MFERGVYWNPSVRLSVRGTSPLPLSRVQFFSNSGKTWWGRTLGFVKISDEFIHGRPGSLNKSLMS